MRQEAIFYSFINRILVGFDFATRKVVDDFIAFLLRIPFRSGAKT